MSVLPNIFSSGSQLSISLFLLSRVKVHVLAYSTISCAFIWMFLMKMPEIDRVHIYYCHQHAEDMRCSCCVLRNSRGSENLTIRLHLLGIHINQSFMGWKKRGEYMLFIDHRHSKWREIYNNLGSNGQAMEEMPWQPHWLFSTSEHAPTWRKRSLPWSACRRPHPSSNRNACWSKGTAIIVLTLTDMWHFPKHITALTCSM